MILDTGCGHFPHGDVNIDLFIDETEHRIKDKKNKAYEKLNIKNIPNFIHASSEYLPFKDNSFEEVFASNVIEHIQNPFLMFKEMHRVTKNIIYIVCPCRFKGQENIMHIHNFDKTWFIEASKKLKMNIDFIRYSDFKYFPHYLLPIARIPVGLEVQLSKKRG